VGDERIFKGGCPVCGYAAVPEQGRGDIKARPREEEVGSLPLWMYILAGSILLAVLGFLLFTLV
jgi:hypothetical protein